MKLGTPIMINGRTGGTPGPAATTVLRVRVPNPARPRLADGIAPAVAFARKITFENLDATNNLQVYLPGQTTFITVKPNSTKTIDGNIHEFTVQSSAATVQWEAVAMVAA